MGRRGRSSRPTSPYNDFAGKSFKQLALEPYPEYPDHYLSSTKRTRAADLIRSQKDLWAKDTQKPHEWVDRVNRELRGKAGMMAPRMGRAPPDNGSFLQMSAPEAASDTHAVYSETRPARNKSVLAWTDHGLVGSDDKTAMRQFRDYGRRPGASDWATSYGKFGEMEGTLKEFKKRGPLPGLFYKGGRKGMLAFPAPREVKQRSKVPKRPQGVTPEPMVKGYDREIKHLAASLKLETKAKERSRSETPSGPSVASVDFSWQGKGIGPLGKHRIIIANKS